MAENTTLENETPVVDYSIKLNASVALKLSNLGEINPTAITTGPIYGFYGVESNIINITHTIAFPTFNNFNNSNGFEDFFNLKNANSKFQENYLEKLRATNNTANLLGWFVSSSGGKFMSQSIIESLYQLQENFKNNKSDIPSILIVYDPLKSIEGYLNLKCYKLSKSFLKTITSENKFIAKNLIENKLSYKNILEEVPVVIKSNNLINLKIQEFNNITTSEDDNINQLSINSKTFENIKYSYDQLSDSINHLNHNLGNLNYFQRNLSRDIAKINKWENKVKQTNEELLKSNPNAKLENTDWRSEFKLLAPSSKFEYLIATSDVNNICNNLQSIENIELVKATGIKESI